MMTEGPEQYNARHCMVCCVITMIVTMSNDELMKFAASMH